MAVWKYELLHDGARLRELTNNDDDSAKNSADVLEQIRCCLRLLKMKLTSSDKEDYEQKIEDLIELMDGEPELLRIEDNDERDDRLMDIGYDSMETHLDLVNERIAEFYDLCDECGCWIGL